MKNLLSITAIALLLSAFSLPTTTFAKGIDIGVKSIHLDDSSASPNSASARSSTYEIDVHVEGKSVSSLTIMLPEEVSVGSVEVTDSSGKTVTATSTIKDKKVAIAFINPIAPAIILQVRLLNASTRWGYSNTWLLPVSAKVDGITSELPLGLARIQTYAH